MRFTTTPVHSRKSLCTSCLHRTGELLPKYLHPNYFWKLRLFSESAVPRILLNHDIPPNFIAFGSIVLLIVVLFIERYVRLRSETINMARLNNTKT